MNSSHPAENLEITVLLPCSYEREEYERVTLSSFHDTEIDFDHMDSGLSPIWISESCLLEYVCGLLPSNKRSIKYCPCFYTWLFWAECAVDFAENTNRQEDFRMCMIYNRALLTVHHASYHIADATTTRYFLPNILHSILKPVLKSWPVWS
jgi:hypothetical protein